MALQVKVDYGGERFVTFYWEMLHAKPCFRLYREIVHLLLTSVKILSDYKDKDGDFVNISPDDSFAFSEMLWTAKH